MNGSVMHKANANFISYEITMIIGRIWLEAAANRFALYIWRLESNSNPTDEPSRGNPKFMDQLGAISRRLRCHMFCFGSFQVVALP